MNRSSFIMVGKICLINDRSDFRDDGIWHLLDGVHCFRYSIGLTEMIRRFASFRFVIQ